ncbi:histone deacetylase [Vibrio sp. ZSDZ34]|uniref:Histone deacetylase n=1 Tax=Vibrio gelatinilyticus TaxID=2893468 RepID=A0A9X1WD67_9VIBR|nr:histone deacetylase [Vibrio gelatinilyticus]MCJ2377255.1 histone deacetylase [Vibrio gelatinilyticus]
MHQTKIPLIYHPSYSSLALPEDHRYPINKYRFLYQAIKSKYFHLEGHPFTEPKSKAVSSDIIAKTHCPAYVESLMKGTLPAAKLRRIGFPWSEALTQRTLTSTGGTCLAVEQALECGIAIHLSGGYHHAHYDYGSGFCVFNDLVIAAKHALELGAEKVLIVDSDVHHGDGTATLTENEPAIVTLSVHCDKNFPARKPASDFDVPLLKGTEDEEFLISFKQVVDLALRIHQPDLVIFDAGVDIHEQDELGFFNITLSGILERDQWLLDTCMNQDIPVACVVGGGYRSQHEQLVPIHMCLIDSAYQVWSRRKKEQK